MPRHITQAIMIMGLSTVLHAGTVFTFDGDPVGQNIPFTDTVNGLSATFTGSGGAFMIMQAPPGFFANISNNFLGDNGTGPTLTIVFSAPINDITLDFVTQAQPALTLTAFDGLSQVGTPVSQTGAVPPGIFLPEGSIQFSGASFDSVVLSSSDGSPFGIDNVTVQPEPGTLILLSAAIVGAFARRFRSGNQ